MGANSVEQPSTKAVPLKDTPLLFILELDNFNVSFVILREAKLMT